VEMVVHLKQMLLVVLLSAAASAKTEPVSKPNCPSKCGNVTIPFPFGLTEACSLNTSFLITCNQTLSPPIPFLNTTDQKVRVLNISLDGNLHVSFPAATRCVDNKTGESDNENWIFKFNLTPFHISSKQNKLTVLGSDTAGVVSEVDSTSRKLYVTTACVSVYSGLEKEPTNDDSCSGNFCCQTPIQQRLSEFIYYCSANIFNSNFTQPFQSYPCGYAFLVKEGAYNFSMADLVNFYSSNNTFPVVMDWTVGNTCLDAQNNASSYACKAKYSECRNAEVGSGYHCQCSTGFRGNPYLPHGCQGIPPLKINHIQCVFI